MKKEQVTSIWLAHQKKYPKMAIDDYIKLIHQSVYGPAHAINHLSIDKISTYLNEELETMHKEVRTDLIIPIGFDYYRVDLQAISAGLIDNEELINAFYESMTYSETTKQQKDEQMEMLLNHFMSLIQTGLITLDLAKSRNYIENYRRLKYPAIHHSERYRTLYHPHYRVVHKLWLSDTMFK